MSKTDDDSVKWDDLHGQMYSRKITRGMLVSDVQFIEYCSLKGSSKPKTEKQFRRVSYNRDYLIRVLIKRVIAPLYPMKWNSYQALLSDAYKIYKAEVKASEKANQESSNNSNNETN